MSRADRIHEPLGDRGLSLIEVIIAILVSSIVLLAVGTILINSWMAQRDVNNITQATNRGQLVASAIERAVRNAEVISVSSDSEVLRVQTTLAGSLRCQGFALHDAGTAQMKTSASSLGADSGWPVWEPGIDQAAQSDGTPIPFFDAWVDNTGVTYTFEMIDGDTAPVRFAGETGARNRPTGEVPDCWESGDVG